MKKLVTALVAAFALAGCNTMQGFGQDLQKVGNKIEGSAAAKK